jgi:hypothetical protein
VKSVELGPSETAGNTHAAEPVAAV